MDTRNRIDPILDLLSQEDRKKVEADLIPIDERVRAKTFEILECIWGAEVEAEQQYDREKHGYYYRMNPQVFTRESGRFSKKG